LALIIANKKATRLPAGQWIDDFLVGRTWGSFPRSILLASPSSPLSLGADFALEEPASRGVLGFELREKRSSLSAGADSSS